MLILATVSYIILAFLRDWDFIWPINALGGEGGCFTQILALAWFVLLFAGLFG